MVTGMLKKDQRGRGVAWIAAAATSAVVAVAGAPTMQAQEKPATEQISLLYSLTGDTATMRLLPGSGNRYAFTLKNADDRTVWFSNRPARDAGTLPTTGFIERWTGFGFTADPPNVAITLHEPNGDTDTIVAVMRKPTITKTGTLKATMEVLSTEKARALTGNLARHGDAHDETIPRTLGSVSVFIDDVNGVDVDGCTIHPFAICDNADMTGANIAGAILTGAHMAGVSLSKANVSGADLSGTNLDSADMTGANMTGANLTGANLATADLRGANLSGANLSGANLANANLKGANLNGANLNGAILITTIWVDGTVCLGLYGNCNP